MRYPKLLLALTTALLLTAGCTTPPTAPAAPAAVSDGQFNVRSFGATGDGVALDTAAINKAIDAAAAAGGGTVVFPAGNYLSFSIHLKSHVALHLGAGATIVAAEPPADLSRGYDAPEATTGLVPNVDYYEDFGHSHWHNSLIWGEDLTDIAITGPGRIFGRGLSRGGGRRDYLPEERAARREAGTPEGNHRVAFPLPKAALDAVAAQKPGPFTYPGRDTLPAGVGNKAIALKNCRNVIFRDFIIYHGGHFGILATGVQNWTCDGLKIDTNRDGIDFDCCQNVRVSNCTVNSPYDDGICPKASFGLGRVMPTENVTITNCQVSGFDEGTLLDGTRQNKEMKGKGTGRIKLGTEANGGFRNLTISNCVFESCRGLALEEVDGGLMEDITITNITMRDINNAPIYLRLGERLRGPAPIEVGTARRIKIDNIVAHNVAAESGILIAGEEGHPVEDVVLSNIFIDFVGGGTKEQAAREVPKYEAARYPEPGRLGIMPSWGLFARHVKNLTLTRVELRTAKEDLRPAAMLDDATGVLFDSVTWPKVADVPTCNLRNAHGITTRDCPGLESKTIE
ncbi:glycosyl hydrolase family 28-related protein [Opitutus sp. GAS368]|uniref:rhamnogalacturonidase n=1 Tax=Opitutus sp. GAS368 TaxID=1882749 RepID=UPI00087C9790|nr:glycosyl hydrolase family 28-related protein [Opitutus sp. GAS368]SDS01600.1 Polygalacturonase [Opitutus sp. GAS368]